MSKMSDLDLAVNEIHTVAQHLICIANSITKIFNQPTETNESDAPTQEKPKPLTLEQVRRILADKSRNGHTEAIRLLLEKHGGNKLSEIDPAEYAAILKEAEALK